VKYRDSGVEVDVDIEGFKGVRRVYVFRRVVSQRLRWCASGKDDCQEGGLGAVKKVVL